MNKKIFSIPLNPKLNKEQFEKFYKWLTLRKEYISDIYFTSRIAPFKKDAMGDLFVLEEDHEFLIDIALRIQNEIGIPVSATFNNTTVPPTQKNLDTFIFNFKRLYDAGVRNATIPHTHWMATGQIKAAFPELFVKNTILRDVRTATEIVNLAKYGFDYINLDRELMRDRETLLRLKEAKEWIKKNLGKEIKFSLLANEGCVGNCSMMVEHFEYNNTRGEEDPQYFNNPISRVSCPKWEVQDPAVQLKTANFPPWRADWEEFINDLGIDTIKMHGRESAERLQETMNIIDRWAEGADILYDTFEKYLKETNLEGRPIDAWRKKIKTCKFDCWECQYCDKIEAAKNDLDFSPMVKYVADCVAESGVPKINTKIEGKSSVRVQTLLHSISRKATCYLELGADTGTNSAAVLLDNNIKAILLDIWGGDKITPNEFIDNIKPFMGDNDIQVFNGDPLAVDPNLIPNDIDFVLYSGPEVTDIIANSIHYYYPNFANEVVIVFNNANDDVVVNAANAIVEFENLKIRYKKTILNDEKNSDQWWNGLHILVVTKG